MCFRPYLIFVLFFFFLVPCFSASQKNNFVFRGHGTVEKQFFECDRLLNEAQRASSGVSGAGTYVNQARQILNQAKADYYRWYNAQQQATASGQFRSTDPFGESLFKGIPLNPDDGKMAVRSFDSIGLAARSEEWGRQMKQIMNKIDAMRKGDQAALSSQVEDGLRMLKASSGATDLPEKKSDGKSGLFEYSAVGLLRNINGEPLSDFGASEYKHIQSLSEEHKYANMTPLQLDALAAEFKDNLDIEKAVTHLKVMKSSQEKLGALAAEVDNNEYSMNYEMKKANSDALKAAEIVGDLTLSVPKGWSDVVEGKKNGWEWLLSDGSSKVVEEGSLNVAAKTGDILADMHGVTDLNNKYIGGTEGVIKAFKAVPELFNLYETADRAGDHYVAAGEYKSQIKASGGTVSAIDKWENARKKTLDASAELYRLIQEAIKKKKDKTSSR